MTPGRNFQHRMFRLCLALASIALIVGPMTVRASDQVQSEPPGAPSNVRVEILNVIPEDYPRPYPIVTQATWTPPPNIANPNESYYELSLRFKNDYTYPGPWYAPFRVYGDSGERSFIWHGGNTGLDTQARVRLVTPTGPGAWTTSNWVRDHVSPPERPDSPTATAHERSVTLNWDAPAGGAMITRWTMRYGIDGGNWRERNYIPGDARSYTVTGLEAGEQYYFEWAAENPGGVGPSTGFVKATPTAIQRPGPPVNPTAEADETSVTLRWEAPTNTAHIDRWNMRYGINGRNWNERNYIPGDAREFTVQGLEAGKRYYFEWAAENDAGRGSSSGFVKATPEIRLPGPPANPTAEAGETSVTLRWEAPANTAHIERWNMRYGIDGGNWNENNIIPGDAREFTLTGLDSGEQYYFEWAAENSAGRGASSGFVKATTLLPYPEMISSIKRTAGDGRILLEWEHPLTRDVTHFRIFHAKNLSASGQDYFTDVPAGPGLAMSHLFTGLENGRRYNFSVGAVNARGRGGLWAIYARPKPLAAPGDVTVALGDGGVKLSWTAPPGGSHTYWDYLGNSHIVRYQLRHKVGTAFDAADEGLWADIPGSDGDTDRYTVTGLADGESHVFQLRAVNRIGPGLASAPQTATPDIRLPDAPVDAVLEARDAAIRLRWKAPANTTHIDNWNLRYGIDGQNWNENYIIPGEWRDFTLTGLKPGREYAVEWAAVNSAGTGPSTGILKATPRLPYPEAPSSVRRTTADGRILVEWTHPLRWDVTHFRIRFGGEEHSFGPWRWIDIPAGPGLPMSHLFTGLNNGESYDFIVIPVNARGEGPFWALGAIPKPLAAPGDVTVAPGDGEAELSWTAPPGTHVPAWDYPGNGHIVRYQLRYKAGTAFDAADEDLWADIPGSNGDTARYTVTGLANDEAYVFQMRAVNRIGPGLASAPQTATPELRQPDAPVDAVAEARDAAIRLRWKAPANTTNIDRWTLRMSAGDDIWLEDIELDGELREFTFDGLKPGHEYAFEWAAVNSAGTGPSTGILKATPRLPYPAVVSSFKRTSGDGRILLAWEHPLKWDVTHFRIYHAKSLSVSGSKFFTDVPAGPDLPMSYLFTGLKNGQEYNLSVRAVNARGEGGMWAMLARPGPLAAPRSVTIAPGDGEAELSWRAPLGGSSVWDYPGNGHIVRYQLRYKAGTAFDAADEDLWADIPGSNGDTARYTVTGLANDEAYVFQMRAVNRIGPGLASAPQTATPELSNRAPVIAPTVRGGNFVMEIGRYDRTPNLNWVFTDPDGDPLTFSFVTDPSPHPAGLRLSFDDSDADQGMVFFETQAIERFPGRVAVTVVATDPDGLSASLTGMLATENSAPAAIDPAPERTVGAGVRTPFSLGDFFRDADGDGLRLTRWSVLSGEPSLFEGAPGRFELLAEEDGRVRLYVEDDFAAPATVELAITAIGLPGKTDELVATGRSGTVDLAWTDPFDSSITSYRLRVAPAGDDFAEGDWQDIPGSAAATTSHSVSALKDGTRLVNGSAYRFQVRAVNAGGPGPASAAASATPEGLPARPANLAAAPGDRQVLLSWADPLDGNITAYQLRAAADGDALADADWGNIPESGPATVAHSVTALGASGGLVNGLAYSFQIRAVNGAGAGPASAAVSAAPRLDRAPSFAGATVADRRFTLDAPIEALVLPEATGGDGALAYALTPALPAGLALDVATRRIAGAPHEARAAATYSWTATDADGDAAALTFTIEVATPTASAAARESVRQSLAGLAAGTLAGARQTIARRLAAGPGAASLTVAGQPVAFAETATDIGDSPRQRLAEAQRSGAQRVGREQLRRDSAFELGFGQAGMEMTAWGRGDLRGFRAEPSGAAEQGRLETGWLGMDARIGDGLLVGLGLSRSASEAELVDGAALTGALTAGWPYAQLRLANGAELWTLLGAGRGTLRWRPEDGAAETGSFAMQAASAGGRQPLATLGDVDLAFAADAGFARLETAGDALTALGGQQVEVWRSQASLEATHRGWGLGSGAVLAPFGALAFAAEGGDWREGSGVEAEAGARLGAPGARLELEARGRMRQAQADASGAELTARLRPEADGAGLSLLATLAQGAPTDGAPALLPDDPVRGAPGGDAAADLALEAGYGLRAPALHGVLTPFLRLELAEDGQDRRELEAGARFTGPLTLDLTATRTQTPETRLHLNLHLAF